MRSIDNRRIPARLVDHHRIGNDGLQRGQGDQRKRFKRSHASCDARNDPCNTARVGERSIAIVSPATRTFVIRVTRGNIAGSIVGSIACPIGEAIDEFVRVVRTVGGY